MAMGHTRTTRRPVAWLLGLMLALMGVYVSVPTAHADGTGVFSSFELEQVFDGIDPANSLDDSPSNGRVATNDSVGYRWNLNVTDVQGATMTQVLPVGWVWDPASFQTIDTDNTTYRASYTLTPDGRTLTVAFDLAGVTSNPRVLTLGVLVAKPTSEVPNESVYTPTVTIDHPGAPAITQGPPVTVLSQVMVAPQKTMITQDGLGEFDFGDGAEPAKYIDFRIGIADHADVLGANPSELAQPATLRDSFVLSGPAGFLDAEFVPETVGKSDVSANVWLSPVSGDPNAFDFTFDGFDSLYGQWVEMRFWVRDSEVPDNRVGALRMNNTVNARGITDVSGTTAVEDAGGNSAEGLVMSIVDGGQGDLGAWANSKSIYASRTAADLPATIDRDPVPTAGQPYREVTRQVVNPGTMVMSRLEMVPAVYDGTSVVAAVSDLIVYDFWDPTEQQLVPTTAPFVGVARVADGAIDSSNYVVEYTNGTDRSQAQTGNTWYGTIAEAGGVEFISGIRIRFLGDWGTALSPEAATLVVLVPLEVVVSDSGNVIDEGQWSWRDVNNDVKYGKRTEFVDAGSFSLSMIKSATPATVLSGATIDFVLRPTVRPGLGSAPGGSLDGLEIVDTLSKGIASVDLSGLPPEWAVASQETTDAGITIKFRYTGTAQTDDQLPEIRYSAVSSGLAPPNSTFTNIAILGAEYNSQPEAPRRSTTVTRIEQSQIASEEMKVYGETLLDVNAPQASWQTRWFNYQTASQGTSYFVDVLPFHNDPATDTRISGTATLASAILLNAADQPAPDSYGRLQFTTEDPLVVRAAGADPNAPIVWIDQEDYDPALLGNVTAVRAVVNDFVTGEAGIGAIRLTLNLEGMRGGDKLTNVSSGWLGSAGSLGATNPATVDIVSSSLGGTVWKDANASGTRDPGEVGYPNAAVTLRDSSGAQVATTTTGSDGSYRFDEIPAGNYTVTTDPQALGINKRYWVDHTYDYDGNLNNDSGVIPVQKGVPFAPNIDFGYRTVESEVSLTKSGRLAEDGELAVAGDRVNWSFTITNTGESTLETIDLVEQLDNVEDIAFDWTNVTTEGQLAPLESVPVTAWYLLTQDDLNSGQVRNIATVDAVDSNSIEVSDEAEAIVTLPEGGSLLLEKNGTLVGEPGTDATLQWEFELRNTGNVSLTGISLQDQLDGLSNITWGAWPDQPFMLNPGETVTASASSGVTQADLDAGCVENTARAYGVTPGGVDAPSNEADASVCFDILPAISLVKSTNGVEYTEAPGAILENSDEVEWTYAVTNTGSETLRDVLLLDDQEGEIAYPAGFDGTLEPDETVTYTATGVATVGEYHNVATVTGVSPHDVTVTDTDESWYTASPAPVPGFALVKEAAPETSTPVTVGQRVTYTLTGTNTGETTLDPVRIIDDVSGISEYVTYNDDAVATINGQDATAGLDPQFDAGTLTWTGTLEPTEAVTITFTVTVNADAEGQTLNNVATGTAQPPGQVAPIGSTPPPIVHPVPAVEPEPDPVFGFVLGKVADPVSGSTVSPGEVVTYTVTGENTGETVLDPVVITDDVSGVNPHASLRGDVVAVVDGVDVSSGLDVRFDSGSVVWSGELPPGEVVTVTYSVVVDAGVSGVVLGNTVSGSAQPPGVVSPIVPLVAETRHPVPVVEPEPDPVSGFVLGKVADPVSGSTVSPGEVVTYTVTGENTGETVLDPVVITDYVSGVNPHASLRGDVVAVVDGVDVSSGLDVRFDSGSVVWSGELPPGEVVTVTYSVVVDAGVSGVVLGNTVSGSAQPPGVVSPIVPLVAEKRHPVPVIEPGPGPGPGPTPVPGTDPDPSPSPVPNPSPGPAAPTEPPQSGARPPVTVPLATTGVQPQALWLSSGALLLGAAGVTLLLLGRTRHTVLRD